VQAAAAAKATLEARHATVVSLMIVAEKVQQPVQREDSQLDRLCVAGFARLSPRDATGDHDIAQKPAGIRDSGFGIGSS